MREERKEFENCPMCKSGKMVPHGSTTTLMKKVGETNKVIDDLRGYKCDSCGYPESGSQILGNVNENQGLSEETTTTADIS
jgi:YgiT-type zinc finger domain-containing protein